MKVFLNGSILDERDAHISVLDRGFLFGDGVYELLRYFDGYGVGVDVHARRLARSLSLARIEGFDAAELGTIARTLLDANNLRDGVVYLPQALHPEWLTLIDFGIRRIGETQSHRALRQSLSGWAGGEWHDASAFRHAQPIGMAEPMPIIK